MSPIENNSGLGITRTGQNEGWSIFDRAAI